MKLFYFPAVVSLLAAMPLSGDIYLLIRWIIFGFGIWAKPRGNNIKPCPIRNFAILDDCFVVNFDFTTEVYGGIIVPIFDHSFVRFCYYETLIFFNCVGPINLSEN